MTTTALAIAAATWAVAMAISPALQIRMIVHRRSARDVSIGYFSVLLVGFALWVAYGIALPNLALIIPNAVALAVAALTIAVAARFRKVGGP